MKKHIFNCILVSIFMCGLFCGCYDRNYFTYLGKVPWGRTSDDLVGVWKAFGKNYGKYYESEIVDVSTIKTLRLELHADGIFRAINWPFENWKTKEVKISPAFDGTWTYKFFSEERLGVLTLNAYENQPFNHIGDALHWKTEDKEKTLRISRSFANFIYLEKEESSSLDREPSVENSK